MSDANGRGPMSATEEIRSPEAQWWAPTDRAHALHVVEVADVRFTADECDALILAAGARTPVETRSQCDDSRRTRSHLWDFSHAWEPENPDPMDEVAMVVCDRMLTAIQRTNVEHFGFDVFSLAYVKLYEYEVGDLIDWHADRTEYPFLKLSASVLLSEPDDVTGGQLEFHLDGRVHSLPVERGRIVVFPSWVTHRVSPVIRGCRHSLIALAAGPPFR